MEEKRPQSKEELGEMTPKEVELIWFIRTKYRYGEVTIETHGGRPHRILKAVEFVKLGE